MTPGPPLADDPVAGTYFSVRLVLPVLAFLLSVATLLEALTSGHWRDSISDYYQGPVRDVFVGSLVGVAACLIAYKGDSKVEDYALNFAGLNAIVVALVPNNFTAVLDAARTVAPTGTVELSRSQIITNLQVSLGALLAAAVLLVVVDRRTMPWTPFDWEGATPLARLLVRVAWGVEGLFGIVLVLMAWRGSFAGFSLYGPAHFGAATLLIVFLAVAVASHGWPLSLRPETWAGGVASRRAPYRVLFWLMAGVLVVGGTLIARKVPFAVIWTEYLEIGLFVLFWVIATRRALTARAP